jgi:hypothetical protein
MVVVVGFVGVLQIVLFFMQCYLLWETVVSSNLPKLIVRRIVIDAPNIGDRSITQPFQQGDTLCGNFTYINIGRRKAKITESYSMFFLTDTALPLHPPYDGRAPVRIDKTLEPGWYGGASITQPTTITDIPHDPHWKLYAMGWIDCVYKPLPLLKSRPVSTVNFCHVWSASHYRFVPLDNPDYENEKE